MADTSVRELFEHYNQGLLRCLPMKNAEFLDILKAKNLLPDEVRRSLEQINETMERSSYFLDKIIIEGFSNSNDSCFINLLAAMQESDYDVAKDFAQQIQGMNFNCTYNI